MISGALRRKIEKRRKRQSNPSSSAAAQRHYKQGNPSLADGLSPALDSGLRRYHA